MIISASRRTDIPALYGEWFFNRIRAGFVDVVNPFNLKQVSRVSLSPKVVDCIVFWTKNAAPIIDRLDELKAYKFYFQFTVTPYEADVEPGLLRNQSKSDIIRTFRRLSEKIGRDKVVWRYDPILLSRKHSIDWHFDQFAYLADKLAPYTNRCVISFLDLYAKTKHNTQPLGIRDISVDEMKLLAQGISQIAAGKIEVQSCSEQIDLDEFGISHGACIDREIVEHVIGAKIDVAKDKTQRLECGCMSSVDIGQYDTCTHLCAYCYANFRPQLAAANFNRHNPEATSLFGEIRPDAKVTERKMMPLKIVTQPTLF